MTARPRRPDPAHQIVTQSVTASERSSNRAYRTVLASVVSAPRYGPRFGMPYVVPTCWHAVVYTNACADGHVVRDAGACI